MSESNDWSDFMKFIREQNERLDNPKTDAEKLRNKLMRNCRTNEEYLALREELHSFMESDASEEDKKMVGGYAESLIMVCRAIDEGRM